VSRKKLMMTLPKQGTSPPETTYVDKGVLLRIKDGDTLVLQVDLGYTVKIIDNFRLVGVNTPEIKGPETPAGLWVTQQIEKWFGESVEVVVDSRDYAIDKYGRSLSVIWCEGRCLNNFLLESKYGWPCGLDGNVTGPRNIELLNIPEGIKQQVRELMV